MLGSAVGAVVFSLLRNWTGFVLFAVSTALATVQLIRIRLRARPGEKGRRW
jgi:hypothetical protein